MTWLRLANKTAIVTGAASGIGAAVAKALTAEGVTVIMADLRNTETSEQFMVECNVACEHSVHALFLQHATKEASILVNCAGVTRDGWISKMSVDDYQDVLDVNLKGTWLMCRSFVQLPKPASIINLSSVVALQGNMGQTNYAASKGGVISLTKALAREVASKNIRVNAVCPGFIDTEMTRKVPAHILQHIQTKIPLNRLGDAMDVADLVLFLASERSRYITGEAIECSGMISL